MSLTVLTQRIDNLASLVDEKYPSKKLLDDVKKIITDTKTDYEMSTTFRFGKYAGKTLAWIFEYKLDYILWIMSDEDRFNSYKNCAVPFKTEFEKLLPYYQKKLDEMKATKKASKKASKKPYQKKSYQKKFQKKPKEDEEVNIDDVECSSDDS